MQVSLRTSALSVIKTTATSRSNSSNTNWGVEASKNLDNFHFADMIGRHDSGRSRALLEGRDDLGQFRVYTVWGFGCIWCTRVDQNLTNGNPSRLA